MFTSQYQVSGHPTSNHQQTLVNKRNANFPYWIFPLFGAAVWFSMLWCLLLIWLCQRQPRYSSMSSNQRVPYISDIGANILKPYFIAACAVTAVSFSVSLMCIRHNQALIGPVEKMYDKISVVSGIIGSAALVALCVFDTARHHDLHFFCLLVFMGGIILSATSTTYEYSRLEKAFMDFEILRVIYRVKLIIVLVEIALSVLFIGAILGKWYMVASCTEWIIAYIYTFYILSFYFGLSPSARTKDREEFHVRAENVHGQKNSPSVFMPSVSQ